MGGSARTDAAVHCEKMCVPLLLSERLVHEPKGYSLVETEKRSGTTLAKDARGWSWDFVCRWPEPELLTACVSRDGLVFVEYVLGSAQL